MKIDDWYNWIKKQYRRPFSKVGIIVGGWIPEVKKKETRNPGVDERHGDSPVRES